MIRVKESISFRAKVFWTVLGLSLMVAFYSCVCWKQKTRNHLDTTMPNLTQFAEGFKEITSFKENKLQSLFGTGEVTYDNPWIFDDSIETYSNLFKSLLIGSLVGIFIGILMGSFAQIEYMFAWPVNLLAGIPPTALLPVFIVFGIMMDWGEPTLMQMLVIFGIAPTFIRTVFLSVKNDIHVEEVNMAYTLGASHCEVIYNTIIPYALPRMIDAVRLTIGPAMVYLILVEYQLGDVGFGYRIRFAARGTAMNIIYIYLLIMSLSNLGMNHGLERLRKWLCPWFEGRE